MNKLTTFFVALICASAIFAADYDCKIGGICYNLDTLDMTAEVTSSDVRFVTNYFERDLYSGSIVIPSKITYKKQTYSVTKIGVRAFEYCRGLKSVKIPTSVTTIGESAFYDCSGLKSVTIPKSVTTIGERAFYNVNNIVYDGTATGSPWGAKCINGYRRGNLIYSDASKTTLCGCSSAAKGKMIIPNSVTTIGENAFYDCFGLKSVTIPNSVTTIGDGAFESCSGLKSVTIPNSVTTIGNGAFYGCSDLKSVIIPNSVTTIGERAFFSCDSLTSINVDTANTHYCSIDGVLFSYAIDTLIQYPKGNTQTEYTIPSSVTTIGKEAFFSCDSLKSVTIPNSVTTIGNWAFYGCRGLQSVTIPTSVTTIGRGAFSYCSGLKSITIPNSVTTIGEGAFVGCRGLQSVTIPNSVTTIGEGAFEDVDNIVYQGSATGSPWGAKYINGYVDEYLIYKDSSKTTLIFCSSAATGNIHIPNSVTTIGNWAFYSKRGLQSIIIPTSVTTIGREAFAWVSGLKSIICYATIPPKCGVDVFYYIKWDAKVYVPASAVEDYQNAEGWKDLQILPITEEVEKSH